MWRNTGDPLGPRCGPAAICAQYENEFTGAAALGFGGQWGYYTDQTPNGEYQPSTGIVTTGYRQYLPAIARYLTRDPLGYDAGPNLYAYCEDDPVNEADPLGLQDYGDGDIPLSRFQRDHAAFQQGFGTLNRAADIAGGIGNLAAQFIPGVPMLEGMYGRDELGRRLSLGQRAFSLAAGAMVFVNPAGLIARNAAQGRAFEAAVIEALGV